MMQRAKRSSSRITDGAASRSSDEDAKTAVKVGKLQLLCATHPES